MLFRVSYRYPHLVQVQPWRIVKSMYRYFITFNPLSLPGRMYLHIHSLLYLSVCICCSDLARKSTPVSEITKKLAATSQALKESRKELAAAVEDLFAPY